MSKKDYKSLKVQYDYMSFSEQKKFRSERPEDYEKISNMRFDTRQKMGSHSSGERFTGQQKYQA